MSEKTNNKKKNKMDKTLTATGFVILIIAVLLIFMFLSVNSFLRKRALNRMDEGVKTITEEIRVKLEHDSAILNATAQTLSQSENLDIETAQSIVKANSLLLETMDVKVLLPDNRVIMPDGTITDAISTDNISFEKEAPRGEHVSNREISFSTGEPILRHFVPVIRNGEIDALVFGTTQLKNLPQTINIDNLYNASAIVYIIDTRSGDLLLDTFHDTLSNLDDFTLEKNESRKTKGKLNWDQCLDNLLKLSSGYVIYKTDEKGGWNYLYYAPAGINEWSIAVEVPEKEAFSTVFVVRRRFIAIFLILAAVIFIYYLYIRKNSLKMTEHAVQQAVLTEKLRKAEAADRAKSIFLSNMSHDIRTPMNAIIGYTTLVQTNLDNRERTQEYLKKILSSSNHMLSLINDILDMSRIESGKLNIEEKECSISDIFKDMRNIIQSQMKSKHLNFYMDTIDVTDEDIYCDKLHVNQVLLNLLSNAIKFTPSGGTIALTIKQLPSAPKGYGSYEIRVKDTGMGMSSEFAKHIFEPFERERNSTVSGIQGTGLGMAITKNIVDAMNGTISVASEQGKGTEFTINLDFRLQTEPKTIECIRELQGLRALVADDNYATCDSVAKMLNQIGMRTDWVMHGKEAVLHAKHASEMGDPYHTYIIDWLLPDLNGLEVVRQIRSIVGENSPIIIVSAYDWTDIEDEARKAGVTAFCSKPIFLSDLRDILMSAVCDTENKEPANEKNSETQRNFESTRLLLTEDNELNREIATEILTENGFIVDTAEDGSVAVEIMKKAEPGQYSLILMDVQMPNMNGYDATRAIRALENKEIANIPIIAMTANAFEEDKRNALEAGMNAHIAKPIDIKILLDTISGILEGKTE